MEITQIKRSSKNCYLIRQVRSVLFLFVSVKRTRIRLMLTHWGAGECLRGRLEQIGALFVLAL